jgi:hypothetical protein
MKSVKVCNCFVKHFDFRVCRVACLPQQPALDDAANGQRNNRSQ